MEARRSPDMKPRPQAPQVQNYGPESRFFDRCKGRRVKLVWKNKPGELCGKLLWVDRFTIGISVETGERDLMIYKDSLQSIEPLNHPTDP